VWSAGDGPLSSWLSTVSVGRREAGCALLSSTFLDFLYLGGRFSLFGREVRGSLPLPRAVGSCNMSTRGIDGDICSGSVVPAADFCCGSFRCDLRCTCIQQLRCANAAVAQPSLATVQRSQPGGPLMNTNVAYPRHEGLRCSASFWHVPHAAQPVLHWQGCRLVTVSAMADGRETLRGGRVSHVVLQRVRGEAANAIVCTPAHALARGSDIETWTWTHSNESLMLIPVHVDVLCPVCCSMHHCAATTLLMCGVCVPDAFPCVC
jgi:hypothetical protein